MLQIYELVKYLDITDIYDLIYESYFGKGNVDGAFFSIELALII